MNKFVFFSDTLTCQTSFVRFHVFKRGNTIRILLMNDCGTWEKEVALS
jgi:hypothetical protein